MLNNPKLNEESFESPHCSCLFTGYLDDDDLTQNNTNNDTSYNDNKEVIDEIISKYEKKIKIIDSENKDMLNRINILKIENKALKMELNKEKKNNENILDKLNKIKQENIDLDKKISFWTINALHILTYLQKANMNRKMSRMKLSTRIKLLNIWKIY